MRKPKRAIVWSVGALAVLAAGVVTFLVVRPGRTGDQLVGTWEGEGEERTRLTGAVGGDKVDLPLATRLAAKATFHKDGRLDYSLRSEAEGFGFSMGTPDGEGGRWEVVRPDRDGLVVRLTIAPEITSEYRVSFRNRDEFAMTPADPAKGTGTIVFRRVGPGAER